MVLFTRVCTVKYRRFSRFVLTTGLLHILIILLCSYSVACALCCVCGTAHRPPALASTVFRPGAVKVLLTLFRAVASTLMGNTVYAAYCLPPAYFERHKKLCVLRDWP